MLAEMNGNGWINEWVKSLEWHSESMQRNVLYAWCVVKKDIWYGSVSSVVCNSVVACDGCR